MSDWAEYRLADSLIAYQYAHGGISLRNTNGPFSGVSLLPEEARVLHEWLGKHLLERRGKPRRIRKTGRRDYDQTTALACDETANKIGRRRSAVGRRAYEE